MVKTPQESDTATLVDGQIQDWVPVDDRGLTYADGVFRTLVVANGQAIAWPWHAERLAHDCQRLGLVMPSSACLQADLERLFRTTSDGIAKITITRGSAGRGYAPPATACTRRIVAAHRARPTPAPVDALELPVSPIVWPLQPPLAGVKHLARLEQVLARAHCDRRGQRDALMCDSAGRMISTTMRNLIFKDRHGRWLTPALTRCGIAGATRARIAATRAQCGQPVRRVDLDLADCAGWVAAIAINSVSGVLPVDRIANVRFEDSRGMAAEARALLAQTT